MSFEIHRKQPGGRKKGPITTHLPVSDTSSELRQAIEAISNNTDVGYPPKLTPNDIDQILALLVAQKQRWEDAARREQLISIRGKLRVAGIEGSVKWYVDDAIAALDGVIGQGQGNAPAVEPLVCVSCGKSDATVKTRTCGYDEDINNKEVWETICDACEHEHLMDI